MGTAALEAQVEEMQLAGMAMSECRDARWCNLTRDNLHHQAQAMLDEQRALDEKDGLFKAIRREGPHSATRAVIASNIKCQMQVDAFGNRKGSTDMHMKVHNIGKNLEEMAHARHELNRVKSRAEKAIKGDEGLGACFAAAFMKSKDQTESAQPTQRPTVVGN